MVSLTFSDATGSSRFTTFTIQESDEEFVTNVEQLFEDGEVKTLRLTGRGVIDKIDELKAVAILSSDFLNNQPLKAFNAETQAASLGSGELVTIQAVSGTYDKSETGVLTVAYSAPAGNIANHLVAITFYPCTKLWLNVGSLSQSLIEAA